jgi:hypothetical protein
LDTDKRCPAAQLGNGIKRQLPGRIVQRRHSAPSHCVQGRRACATFLRSAWSRPSGAADRGQYGRMQTAQASLDPVDDVIA